MFIALDSNKNRISIENATTDGRYYCPICGEELRIRAKESLAVRTHFAHKRGTLCFDDWTHDMSEWHLSWQKQFPEETREVVLERNGIKHRADVLINGTVIEFQHSPITAEEIAKRNSFYLDLGYRVVWVFDATDKIINSTQNTLDPMKCRKDELCWKRPKQQFSLPIPPQVKIYLQYKTEISNPDFPNQQYEILLPLLKVEPKNFIFLKTIPFYIIKNNFLKEYGAINCEDILSISDIIKITNFKQQKIKKRYFVVPFLPTINRRPVVRGGRRRL